VKYVPAKIGNTDTPSTTPICTRLTIERYTKPAGLNASIWATSPVSTISPTRTAPATTSQTKTNLGDKPLTIAQVPAGRPSELVRLRRTTPQILPEAVEAMRLDWQRKFPASQQPAKVSNGSSIKKTFVGSSLPVSPPVRQRKTTSNGSGSRNTDPTGEDFELVEHGELEEDFDVVDDEGPSAANGAK
jgi:hypothetical protein